MPEGDTVWLTAHRLDQALGGRVLTRCDLRVPQLATTDLLGMRVLEVVPRGKHLLARLDSGWTLHSHLRMDGLWYLTRAGTAPRRYAAHQLRAQLGNVEWLASGYRVHDLRVVATSAESELVGHLGPDLLGPDWDPNEAVNRLLSEPQRAIGETLLDQRHLAGIGNLYKCETLFLERIHPWRATGAVPDLHRLVDVAQRLLQGNRAHPAQSTTGRTGRGQEHWVYRRAGEACFRCRTAIAHGEQGEAPRRRSTYWCPSCQPTELAPRQ